MNLPVPLPDSVGRAGHPPQQEQTCRHDHVSRSGTSPEQKRPDPAQEMPAHERPGQRELILGGQRSGKSRRAELLASQWLTSTSTQAGTTPRAIFIATATAQDAEMRARIAQHQADRAQRLPGMCTIEEPLALPEVIAQHSAPDCLLVVDCLTLWLSNQYEQIDAFRDGPLARSFLQAIEQCQGPLIIVSNEIGLGVIPMGREVRAYVDALGWLNQQVAARCERVCLMAAGLPLWLKHPGHPQPLQPLHAPDFQHVVQHTAETKAS